MIDLKRSVYNNTDKKWLKSWNITIKVQTLWCTVQTSTSQTSPHLGRSVFVGSADQCTPLNPQPVTQQLCDGPRPQQPREILLLLQVKDAPSWSVRRSVLQDNRAWSPGPGVEVGHQPIRLPDDMTGKSGRHSAGPRGTRMWRMQVRLKCNILLSCDSSVLTLIR